MSVSLLPDVKVSLIGSDESSTLKSFCLGKNGVIDIWHTKCIKCPAALEKLNEEASAHEEFVYIACALSQGSGNKDAVTELVNDWENLTHIFVEEEDKESIKTTFGYSSVPFYIVFDKDGNIIKTGDPKSFDLLSTLKSIGATSSETKPTSTESVPSIGTLVLDEDF